MKRAIDWVDTLVRPSGVDIRPSTLLNLVQEVRREALDTVELHVRRQGDFADGSDAKANQDDLLRMLTIWGKA